MEITIIKMDKHTMSTNISLTPELEQYAKSKVAEGLYSSISELMRDALRQLRRNDIEYMQEMRVELSQAAGEIDQGDITPLNMQEIMDEVDTELAR